LLLVVVRVVENHIVQALAVAAGLVDYLQDMQALLLALHIL
jgi:hypothetical protein